ncbi:hypothetical protein NPIL_91 [Nephila pilipes]|uniref:Uncharacterized protein n=1 Tax=Nephila pilipes TaxID=299642 RepID=A0A8X6QC25_NEPPI|nr:hypothetical protein NPIL_91 [Nephila pilipes]
MGLCCTYVERIVRYCEKEMPEILWDTLIYDSSIKLSTWRQNGCDWALSGKNERCLGQRLLQVPVLTNQELKGHGLSCPKEKERIVQGSDIEVVTPGNHPVHRAQPLQSRCQMQRIKRSMDGGHTCVFLSPTLHLGRSVSRRPTPKEFLLPL